MFCLAVLSIAMQLKPQFADPSQLLHKIFERRASSNISIKLSIDREEVFSSGKTRRKHLILGHAQFGRRIYCELHRDEGRESYSYKLCNGCYQPDRDLFFVSSSESNDTKPFLFARTKKEAYESKMVFDLRLIGFYTFEPEGIDSDYTRPYLLEIYEKPRVNSSLSHGDICCIELRFKDKSGYLRYFINLKLNRLEKTTLEDSQFSSSVSVESIYNSNSDLFPTKIKKTISSGNYKLVEDVVISEVRWLAKIEDFDWSPGVVGFHPNVFVACTVLLNKKNPVQSSLFYDGKVLRQPTSQEIEIYGMKFDSLDEFPSDNASVVSHTECVLSKVALARRTFSRIASALAVHWNPFPVLL
ncbi:hypothetical protein KIH39_15110 [Telmatocola sphagniphila]|uniref:Uncharacterized protein n=1 Tax=Telmatocola sphagniphila TaxID=1123043 RepID=A0A8E6B2Q0_9BACT|nr:hypothetical protein [Telmatocola sphagniphila]QVL30182.1 hypothetical protein KIH39_15110 [Telmatocola sphagniphila]